MAEEHQNLHDTAALRALAGGEDLGNGHESPMEPSAENAFANAPTEPTGESSVSEPSFVPPPGAAEAKAPQPAPTRRARQNQFAGKQRRHAGIQFRKTAIPLLLVMAVLLIAAGGYTLLKTRNSDPETLATNPFLAHGNLFAALAIGLGVCLVAGGLFFQYEVRKHHKNQK